MADVLQTLDPNRIILEKAKKNISVYTFQISTLYTYYRNVSLVGIRSISYMLKTTLML